jgi:hypothetical protein
MTQMRVRANSRTGRRPLLLPTDFQLFMGLEIPDPITFVISPQWLNRPLYPRQATLIKIIFLRTDLLTDYDREVIAEWETSFLQTGNNGITPDIIGRMDYLRAHGYPWFREVLLVMGRRAGKGYVSALAMAYVLWCYMAKGDPQQYYGIDRSKKLTCTIYAGKKDQARDNLWRDLVNVIIGAPCYTPYVNRPMGESLSVYAPADKIKMAKLARRGIITSMDMATFKIEPKEATPMSGRGNAGFCVGFDEMAHVVASGANRSADEIYKAVTPALDQFKTDAFIVEPSSPWEMTGQFYQNWIDSLLIDETTGQAVYPEKMMIQLASWEIYYDWAIAHELPLFPEDFTGDLDEYVDQELPKLAPLRQAIQEYDESMEKLEKADPDTFSVERRSHWQTTLDAYLDPAKISAMFAGWNGRALGMTTRGVLAHFYKGHADPSLVNDNFGVAVAHLEKDEQGYDHCIFDYISHWDPANFPDHTIDYMQINEELWELIKGFPIDDFSFDQHNSAYFIADLTYRTTKAQLPKRIAVHEQTATAPHNLRVWENFKVALNLGWVHAPYYEQGDLELRFLQFKNGKVVHQTTGPVQHDDVARSMAEVVWGLLEGQVHRYRTGGKGPGAVTGTIAGGMRPWMAPANDADQAIFSQFQQLRQGRRQGEAPRPGRASGNPYRRTPTGYH